MLVYQVDFFSLISLLQGTHYPNVGMLLKVPLWLWLEETRSVLTEYHAINESMETWRFESIFEGQFHFKLWFYLGIRHKYRRDPVDRREHRENEGPGRSRLDHSLFGAGWASPSRDVLTAMVFSWTAVHFKFQYLKMCLPCCWRTWMQSVH